MEEKYFVATSTGTGIIGTFTGQEIRSRLASGTLSSTDVCVSTTAAGEIASQWRPLTALFGPTSGVPVEDRITAIESRLNGLRAPGNPEPRSGVIGSLLLTFGQFVAVLGCLVSIGAGIYGIGWVQEPPHRIGLLPLVLSGSVASCVFWAALFVVFTRVKQVPPG